MSALLYSDRRVKPDIIDPAQCIVLPISINNRVQLFLAPLDLKTGDKYGILPDRRIVKANWHHLFPYDAVEIFVSRNPVTSAGLLKKPTVPLVPFNPQKLQVNAHANISISIIPLAVADLDTYVDVDHLTRELMVFSLFSKHHIEFDYADFIEYADAPLLHLRNGNVSISSANKLVRVIQVKVEHLYKPAFPEDHPNAVFTWGKLFETLERIGLSYCPDDFMVRCFLDTMPEVLEFGSYKPSFSVIQPLSRKIFYQDNPDEKLLAGFQWDYNPYSENKGLPIVKLSSWERRLDEPVFQNSSPVYKADETDAVYLWMSIPDAE